MSCTRSLCFFQVSCAAQWGGAARTSRRRRRLKSRVAVCSSQWPSLSSRLLPGTATRRNTCRQYYRHGGSNTFTRVLLHFRSFLSHFNVFLVVRVWLYVCVVRSSHGEGSDGLKIVYGCACVFWCLSNETWHCKRLLI